uniref:Mor transcription activator family protein n=1 Tax=Thaumasiovibrio occultus TaxID=1891184 RepID=UPI000B352D63|nr:Mor transcription activator family protein [Thaumasiovibrio occultus]
MDKTALELFDDVTAEEWQELLERPEDDSVCEFERLRWPSTLQSLVELLVADLERENVANARGLAAKLTSSLAVYFGGRDIYIPKGDVLKTSLRNIQIWRDFTGRNIEQLAAQHNLTERQITAIIKEQRKLELQRRQRVLF